MGVGKNDKVWEKNKTSSPPPISSGNQKKKKLVRIKGTKLAVLKELYNEGKLTKKNRCIARNLHLDHKTSKYHLDSMIPLDLVMKTAKHGIYKITQKGIDIVLGVGETLVMSDTKCGRTTNAWYPTDDAHNYKVKVKVVDRPSRNDWLNSWQVDKSLKNQVFYNKRFGDIRMTYTMRNVIFQFPRLNFSDSDEASSEILRITEELCLQLESEVEGLKLGTKKLLAQVISQHHAMQNEPYSVFLKKHNLSYKGKNVDIDASHKDIPEIEFTNSNESNYHHGKFHDFINDLNSKNPLGYAKFVEDFVVLKDDITMSDILGVLHKNNENVSEIYKLHKEMMLAIISTQKQIDSLTKSHEMNLDRLSIIENETREGYWKKYL